MRSALLFPSLLLLSLLHSAAGQYSVYTAGPINWYTFDVEPGYTRLANLTSFTWTPGRSPHTGNAYFNGNDSRIDVLTFADDNGKTLPRSLPASFSLEYWASYTQLGNWARLFDCGSSTGTDNIIMAIVGTTTDLQADFIYNSLPQRVTAARAVHPNSWQHIVATMSKNNNNPFQQTATVSLYVDGVLKGRNANAILPRTVTRRDCWLGKSNYEWDANFVGSARPLQLSSRPPHCASATTLTHSR